MKTNRILQVPTGHILTVQGEKGQLECLSLGDYGQNVNIKASFLGLDRDIDHVAHQELLPLKEKWVITISTQYGCSMNCKFCDVPKVGPGRNATVDDLVNQVKIAMGLHPEVTYSKRLNLHYARMGEPTWNPNVLKSVFKINEMLNATTPHSFKLHPVVSTMMPRNNKNLQRFLEDWCEIKNNCYLGDAGLQLSINSTNEHERQDMFSENALSLSEISRICSFLPVPRGRKYTLNFAVANYTIDAKKLAVLFDPKNFIIKLTPMHKTQEALKNDIKTMGDYTCLAPYQCIENELKEVGFDVLVFIASQEEDLGRITCGNAILSGTNPEVDYKELKVS
jgi:23S rRNA (adenine2503-C2)-methyltransferase